MKAELDMRTLLILIAQAEGIGMFVNYASDTEVVFYADTITMSAAHNYADRVFRLTSHMYWDVRVSIDNTISIYFQY